MDAGLNRKFTDPRRVRVNRREDRGNIDRAGMTAPQSRTGSRDRLTTTMVLDERET